MSIDDILDLSIAVDSQFPAKAGFGVPLLVAYHTGANMFDMYKSLTDVADDHDVNSAPYLMARAAFSQQPRPKTIAIGKRLTSPTMIVTLTPKNVSASKVYAFNFVSALGVVTPVSASGATATIVAAAWAVQLAGIVGATAAAATGVLTITAGAAGSYFNVTGLPDLNVIAVENTTADPGLTADLNAIYDVDSTTWYGFSLDSESKAEILAAAAWTEPLQKIHLYNSSDSKIADNTISTDVASSLKAAAYARTAGLFAQSNMRDYRALALMSKMFTTIPGASTWYYQTLAGITVDKIKGGDVAKIAAKNIGVYLVTANLNATDRIKTGSGEFLDVVVGRDALYAQLGETIWGYIYSASNSGGKVPFTDGGIKVIQGLILGVLNAFGDSGFLDKGSPFTVNFPRAKDIDPSDKAARHLPGGTFGATMQGAIHTLELRGILSV